MLEVGVAVRLSGGARLKRGSGQLARRRPPPPPAPRPGRRVASAHPELAAGGPQRLGVLLAQRGARRGQSGDRGQKRLDGGALQRRPGAAARQRPHSIVQQGQRCRWVDLHGAGRHEAGSCTDLAAAFDLSALLSTAGALRSQSVGCRCHICLGSAAARGAGVAIGRGTGRCARSGTRAPAAFRLHRSCTHNAAPLRCAVQNVCAYMPTPLQVHLLSCIGLGV